jgi:hypothetical protein
MVASAHGGRRHSPRRMIPDNCWTFDVMVRRGTAGTVFLGRWSFGPHRGIEEATGDAMRRLGHVGDYRYVPVGWPSHDYYLNRLVIFDDIKK